MANKRDLAGWKLSGAEAECVPWADVGRRYNLVFFLRGVI